MSPRDRRALRLGAIASAVVVVVALTLPALRHASAREALITERHAELARLLGLAQSGDQLAPAVAARQERLASAPQRPLAAPSPERAAAALQSLLQQYADESQLTVAQLDVTGAADADGVPATLVATGDLYAVADILSRLEAGAVLFDIREMTVQPLPGQRGASGQERLQLTVVLRAPVVGP